MKQYEYKVVDIHWGLMEGELNRLGLDGWSLVQIADAVRPATMIFIREIKWIPPVSPPAEAKQP